jgi:hypothetical protein
MKIRPEFPNSGKDDRYARDLWRERRRDLETLESQRLDMTPSDYQNCRRSLLQAIRELETLLHVRRLRERAVMLFDHTAVEVRVREFVNTSKFPLLEMAPMPAVVPFYSIDEETKPSDQRVYHNHTECPIGLAIPESRRNKGTHGYRLCPICDDLIERKSVV